VSSLHVDAATDICGEEKPGTATVAVDPQLIAKMLDTVKTCFQTDSEDSIENVREFIVEAIRHTDTNFGVSEAVLWADGFEWPSDLVARDAALLASAGHDFSTMVRIRLTELGPSRLSALRVQGLRADNPEISLLSKIAQGMTVPLPADFIPNGRGTTGKLTKAYLSAAPAVDKMLYDLHQLRLGFVLETSTARNIPNCHYANASWTIKRDKACGRGLSDMP
jgi:hypothetical protein